MLEARGLVKRFPSRHVTALDGVSFRLEKGKTLGIVGESGSGKSTLAKIALGLLRPDAGEVFFEGEPVFALGGGALKRFRRRVQAVFQEPFLSLNPRMKVGEILKEPFEIHGLAGGDREGIARLLRAVELDPGFASRYPRELSGGECQRVAIARALSLDPAVIVCDEAVSALDALVQVQILNLLLKLQEERQVSYLFISHALKVVRHMSDDVLVLKDGLTCESGPREAVFASPKHPYTRTLLRAAGF
jgi:peptide/nickel transport system ATP-binding protein/oligopeptide transport system ATP-binding protein